MDISPTAEDYVVEEHPPPMADLVATPYRTPTLVPPLPRASWLARRLRAWPWLHGLRAVRRYVGGSWYVPHTMSCDGVCVGCREGPHIPFEFGMDTPAGWRVTDRFGPRWAWPSIDHGDDPPERPRAPLLAVILRGWAWSHQFATVRDYLGGAWIKNHACPTCEPSAPTWTQLPQDANPPSGCGVVTPQPPRWSHVDGG